MTDVFISYSRADKERVAQLAAAIEAGAEFVVIGSGWTGVAPQATGGGGRFRAGPGSRRGTRATSFTETSMATSSS